MFGYSAMHTNAGNLLNRPVSSGQISKLPAQREFKDFTREQVATVILSRIIVAGPRPGTQNLKACAHTLTIVE